MFIVPRWLLNILFLAAFGLSLYQIGRLTYSKRPYLLQFVMAVFSIIMVPFITFTSQSNAWLSYGFLVVGIVCAAVMFRRLRYMPQRDFSR